MQYIIVMDFPEKVKGKFHFHHKRWEETVQRRGKMVYYSHHTWRASKLLFSTNKLLRPQNGQFV